MLAERLLESQKACSDTAASDKRLPVGDEDSLERTEDGRAFRLEGENRAEPLTGDAAVECDSNLSGEFTSKLDNMSIFFSRLALASSRPSAFLT